MEYSRTKYKFSQYNVLHQDNDTLYMWNTFSNALIKLDKKAQDYISNFSGTEDGSEKFKLLKNNGFIVFDKINEFGRICLQQKQVLFSNSSNLSISIAPGMGCNYKCIYCFEASSDISGVMTYEIANDVVEYICKKLTNNENVKSLFITWFGGEPLLYIDIIENLSRKIISYAEVHNINYSAGIITNGRMLDKISLKLLKELHIDSVQITLDGIYNYYCKSKNATISDFNHVIENIEYCSDKINLSIRINIVNNDAHQAIKVTDFIFSNKNISDTSSLYFAFLRDYTLKTNDARKAYINYVDNYLLWLDYIIKRYGTRRIRGLKPRRMLTHCGLVKSSNFCIGPYGELYRCQRNFGDFDRVSGDIWHGKYYNENEFLYYSLVDGSENQNCTQCDYLPICMGRCADYCVSSYDGFDCESFKRLHYKMKLIEGGIY